MSLVDKYIQEIDWKVKENANMAYSLQGLNNYIASIVSSKYWMNRVYTKEIREAHEGGDFYIHDLQLIAAYCCGWDLQDLIRRGFTGVRAKWLASQQNISEAFSGRWLISSIPFRARLRGRRLFQF